jgi:hypothetical protein
LQIFAGGIKLVWSKPNEKMPDYPQLVAANAADEIFEIPNFRAAGRSGRDMYPLDPAILIPLPENSRLYFLPQRAPVGYSRHDQALRRLGEHMAVAAFLPPGYTIFSVAAYHRQPAAPLLPIYAYSAVCWYRGQFHVPALRIDDDVKHDPAQFSWRKIKKLVEQRRRQFPANRLIAHHGVNCALRYGCPNAQNLFFNLNIDPDWYVDSIALRESNQTLGMPALLQKIREKIPESSFWLF